MGTKIFDYMALKRQIIFCYTNEPKATKLKEKYYTITERPEISNSLQQDLIEAKNAGIIIEDESHLFNVFNTLKMEFSSTGKINCETESIDEFSRRSQTGKLAGIIKNITK